MEQRRQAKKNLVIDPTESIVAKFLETECVHSPFETDYIILSDMEKAFKMFCDSFVET
jgi:hypothetical protein